MKAKSEKEEGSWALPWTWSIIEILGENLWWGYGNEDDNGIFKLSEKYTTIMQMCKKPYIGMTWCYKSYKDRWAWMGLMDHRGMGLKHSPWNLPCFNGWYVLGSLYAHWNLHWATLRLETSNTLMMCHKKYCGENITYIDNYEFLKIN
jgi:hypothetical protein